MKKIQLAFKVASILFCLFSSQAKAQSIGVVCINSSSKAITVQKSSCPKGTTLMTASNLDSGNLSFSKCYVQTGTASDSAFDGKVAVSLSCKNGYQVVNDEFDSSDSTRAYPKISRKTLTYTKGVPTAEELEMTGNSNSYYTITAKIICCPVG